MHIGLLMLSLNGNLQGSSLSWASLKHPVSYPNMLVRWNLRKQLQQRKKAEELGTPCTPGLCVRMRLLLRVLRLVRLGVNKAGASCSDPRGRRLLVPGPHLQ